MRQICLQAVSSSDLCAAGRVERTRSNGLAVCHRGHRRTRDRYVPIWEIDVWVMFESQWIKVHLLRLGPLKRSCHRTSSVLLDVGYMLVLYHLRHHFTFTNGQFIKDIDGE